MERRNYRGQGRRNRFDRPHDLEDSPGTRGFARHRSYPNRPQQENGYDRGNRPSYDPPAPKLQPIGMERRIGTSGAFGPVRNRRDPVVKKLHATNLLQEQNLLNGMIRDRHHLLLQQEIEKEKMLVEMKNEMYKGRAISFEEERHKAEFDEKKRQMEVVTLEMRKLEHRMDIDTFKNEIFKLEDECRKLANRQEQEIGVGTVRTSPEFGEGLLQQHKILTKGQNMREKQEKKQARLRKKIESYVHKNTLKCPNFLDRLKYERQIQARSQREAEQSMLEQYQALEEQRITLEVQVNRLEVIIRRREREENHALPLGAVKLR